MSYQRSTADVEGYVPFPDERIREYLDAGHWTNDTFHDVLDRAVAAAPDRAAAVDPYREITYVELQRDTERIAAYLAGELGLEPNDRIVLQLSNRIEFLQAFFACSRIGVVPTMLLPRHRESEARHVVDLVDARAYVTLGGDAALDFDYVSMVDELRGDYGALEHCVAVDDDGSAGGDWIDFADLRERDWTDEHGDRVAEVDVNPNDPGVMLLSGGTTGMPKGIPRTYNDYVFQWRRWSDVARADDDWVMTPSVPIGHNAALNCIVGFAVSIGGTLALEPRLKPEPLLETFVERDVDYFFAVPTQLVDFLEHPRIDDYDLSGVSAAISGGQKVRPRAAREFDDRWGIGLLNIFGMAEGPLICTRPDDPVEIQAHTVGRPIAEADEHRLVDLGRESEVPTGEPGELAVRGPGIFTGYFRNEAENDENFDDEGWFYTEDVLSRREDGRFEVHGRIKDTIIRGGENIYAPGVEDELIEHPDVENVAVVGIPDERLGERPMAYVQPRPDADPDDLALDALDEFLDDRGLAVFKRPERLKSEGKLPEDH